ncbi:hypothetical protein NXV48_21590 [Bacteroides thetaiotaomicron]|nr:MULTISPECIES: hypothetical protein [Bacteroides]MCS3094350.1 hypothetical protein [Bacteroides thetaiotaomicron]
MRRSLSGPFHLAAYHYPCVEIAMDEGDYRIVLECPLQYLYQLGMVDGIKEAFKVYVHCIAVALIYYLCHLDQYLLRPMVGAEAVTPLTELSFIDWDQHLGDCLLYHAVYNRGYPQQAFLPVILEYFHSADGVRTICPLAYTLR